MISETMGPQVRAVAGVVVVVVVVGVAALLLFARWCLSAKAALAREAVSAVTRTARSATLSFISISFELRIQFFELIEDGNNEELLRA
jgi:type II secretory pathway pseudopilin PulG